MLISLAEYAQKHSQKSHDGKVKPSKAGRRKRFT